jgi:hypothetical protein
MTLSRLKDYQPLSILPALSKALENIMKDQIVAFCNGTNHLNRFQSDFTVQRLLFSIELDQNFISILVLVDFSKAFDTVNFKLLS